MRLSLRKAALGLPTPLSLTGNPEGAEGPAVRLSFLQLLIQFHSQGKDDSRSILGFTLNRERRHIATTRNSNHLVGGSLGQYLIPGLSSRRPALHKPSTANQG